MHDYEKDLTFKEAIKYQDLHLADWKTKLTPECYNDLHTWAKSRNKDAKRPDDVKRGMMLDSFIKSWQPREKKVKTDDYQFKDFFINDTGDKMFIEVEITGDPNESTATLYKSFKDETDLVDGVKVTQMLFKGKHPETVINEKIDDALLDARNRFTELVQEIRQELK